MVPEVNAPSRDSKSPSVTFLVKVTPKTVASDRTVKPFIHPFGSGRDAMTADTSAPVVKGLGPRFLLLGFIGNLKTMNAASSETGVSLGKFSLNSLQINVPSAIPGLDIKHSNGEFIKSVG